MAKRYNAGRSYRAEYDVRHWADLAEHLRDNEPDGALWAIVGQRRSGKTWALRAIEGHLKGLGVAARYLDLQQRGNRELAALLRAPENFYLVDEPGRLLFEASEVGPDRPRRARSGGAEGLLDAVKQLRDAGKQVLIAMTPAEWSALRQVGVDDGRVNDKDLRAALGPLQAAESRRIARDEGGRALIAALTGARARWLRSPFLLTLLLEIAEAGGHLEGDPSAIGAAIDAAIGGLLRATIDAANDAHRYTTMVLYEGLDAAQQALLRRIARAEEVDAEPTRPLLAGGLVDRDDERAAYLVGDPVIADHLPPPLRIHHISDVHVGAKAATRVWAGGSAVAGTLADAAGRGPVRESYREHLSQRSGRGEAPHLVVISGDLVETGADPEFAEARAFLDSLRPFLADHPDLRPGDPRILIVGGNHDVDWKQTRGEAGARARHFPFARAFDGIPRPHLEEPPESRELTVVRYPDAGVAFALLGSAEFSGQLDPDLIDLLDRARERALETGASGAADEAQRLRDRLGRIDPGLVHQGDLGRLRATPWKESVRIAVLHHPLSPLPSSVDVVPYAGLINAGAVKDALIDREFCLALHGHLHSQWIGEERWSSHQRGGHVLRIAAAPSLGSREVHESHGYNEILVHREGDERFELAILRYRRQGDTWHRDDPQPRRFRPGAVGDA